MADKDKAVKKPRTPHARVRLDIWGNDDWLDLPADAQCLYLTLYTSPGRTLCGSHEWNPGKIRQRAADWTIERIEAAAEILSERLFLIIDAETSECLIRSWIKHDGLWRTPNMCVSIANARNNLASRALRGVVVFEVLKLRTAEANSTSWNSEVVSEMLKQSPVDPVTLEPFKGASNGVRNPVVNGVSNGAANPYVLVDDTVGGNGALNGAPTITTAVTITTATKRDDNDSSSDLVEPPYIENGSKPPKRYATNAAKTVVRQSIGNSYPRTTVDRLAVQVDKLAHEGHPDTLIREALKEWDRRPAGTKPEFLPTILGDVVKASRAAPPNGRTGSKVRGYSQLAAEVRAQEQAQALELASAQPKELE